MDASTFFCVLMAVVIGVLGCMVYMNYTARKKRQTLIKKIISLFVKKK